MVVEEFVELKEKGCVDCVRHQEDLCAFVEPEETLPFVYLSKAVSRARVLIFGQVHLLREKVLGCEYERYRRAARSPLH